jgi:hypothetical protein
MSIDYLHKIEQSKLSLTTKGTKRIMSSQNFGNYWNHPINEYI